MTNIPQNLDVRAIANALLQEGWARGCVISHLKLQKLLFLCHAFYLVKTRSSGLVRGNFEAWQYGPVHREAYEAFKNFGDQPITAIIESMNPVTGIKNAIPLSDNQLVKDTIADVIRFCGHWNASQLVELTHAEEGPWHYVVKTASKEANMGLRISNEIILQRFKYHWFGAKNKLEVKELNDEKPIVA